MLTVQKKQKNKNIPVGAVLKKYFVGKSNFPSPTSISNENCENGLFGNSVFWFRLNFTEDFWNTLRELRNTEMKHKRMMR